jgi:hypothetical protein
MKKSVGQKRSRVVCEECGPVEEIQEKAEGQGPGTRE